MTVLATELKEQGRLARDAVVVTVMSNQGFHVAMREAGIAVIETPVGDKHVAAAMRDGGYLLGGEQSGHIILLEYAPTGDGILTSLQLLAAVHRHGMPLAAAVVEHGADAGVAYDGDADRCLAVDADGQPLDGDQILTVLATELAEAGRLPGGAVVVTVMSNQGFHVAMRDAGIAVIETPVGDKHVAAAMRDGGYLLGGEQSGHIILLEHAPTGDGILTSLHLLAAVQRRGMPMAAAAKMMRKYPQVLVNVPGDASQLGPGVDAAVARAESVLGDSGRVLVRPSGTEPAIRVMVQAADAALAERVIGQLAAEVRLALAGQ